MHATLLLSAVYRQYVPKHFPGVRFSGALVQTSTLLGSIDHQQPVNQLKLAPVI